MVGKMSKLQRSLLTALFGIPFLIFVLHSSTSSSSSHDSDYVYSDESSNGGAQLISVRSVNSQPCNCDTSSNLQNRYSNNNSPLYVPFVRSRSRLNESVHSENTVIFLITPTYTRASQMADMTRLAQTLMLVPDIFWIVVEDSHNYSRSVNQLLIRSGIPFVQLLGPRPVEHMDQRSGRGVSNRLKAFEFLRANYADTPQSGVIYFMDDDNAYDIRLFDEMRSTKVVSMFPVGMINSLGLSTPIVSAKTGKIIGFHDPFIGRRKFAVDMAGFAVNLQYFLSKKNATMPYKVGYEEDFFLKSLGVQTNELEPKANNCTEVLVWHTKTKPGDTPSIDKLKKVTKYAETNLPALYEEILRH